MKKMSKDIMSIVKLYPDAKVTWRVTKLWTEIEYIKILKMQVQTGNWTTTREIYFT